MRFFRHMVPRRDAAFSVLGFRDEAHLVRGIAKYVGVQPQFIRPKRYRAGEWTVFSPAYVGREAIVVGNAWEDPRRAFRLALLLHAVKEAGAKRVTLIAPWIAYGRQDRPAKKGDTAAGDVMANLLLSSGTDHVVTLDAHSPAFAAFFRGRLTSAYPLDAIAAEAKRAKITAVAAPDLGAKTRARLVAKRLHVPVIVVGKTRLGPGRVESRLVSGKPAGHRVLLVDDIADTGGTLREAAKILKKNGAKSVMAYVSHAVDAAAASRRGKKHGLTWVKAAFDHATGALTIPPAVFFVRPR